MCKNLKQSAQEMLKTPSFDKYSLSDISSYTVTGEDECAKMRSFLNFVKNPYLFRVGDIAVHVVFSGDKGNLLQSHIYNLLTSKL